MQSLRKHFTNLPLIEEVTKNQVESETAAETGTNVKPQSREEVTKNQVESDTAAESGTYVEPQNTEEVSKNEMETGTTAECEEFNAEEASEMMNVKPQSREEVTKNQVEILSDEENVGDSVKAMEEVVKEQMDVIRELSVLLNRSSPELSFCLM